MVTLNRLLGTPPGLSPADAERAAALRRMKTLALSLLLGMAVVFAVSFALQGQYAWLQYVRAASEGGMVGALADWFAVTALFRHPLGLPIPHTAIIPTRKDAIGASLSGFVRDNFLSSAVVRAKLDTVDVARKAGTWLASPGGAERVSKEGAAVIRGAFTVLNDDDVQSVIEGMVRKHLLTPPWGPPLGRVAEQVFEAGHHHQLVDLLVDRAADWVAANYATVTRVVTDRSPSWVPNFANDLVGDKVYIELSKFVAAVQSDPNHQARQSIDAYLRSLALDLQHEPAMIARVEGIKAQVLGDPQVRSLAGRTWATIKRVLLEAVSDPRSELHQRFTTAVRDFGARLVEDEELAGKVNAWVADAAAYIVATYRDDIAGVIEDTVARWDAEETSQKIELQVGKDLQFIRINGTVVGALAGVLIFAVAHAIFGG
ncbi:DUF445 domain-containing protein [Sinomonas sp. ASV486]|uniref:DUF445 domain-containing protein n=1 Tax=Sinomonas puerhi TaxID=3238584 RepID=A0AB39L5N4_9MICC|nr:DUF445 domain-containing protein [Sinomonas sp. ASV486]MDQ4490212.1 DUF445 domain-containing protein [Sinomonas sp. ASV486]